MLSAYPACFLKEENCYSVIFPDLNYLATSGETVEEAMAMAVDCLAGYLYVSGMDGEEVPPPSDLKQISLSDIREELGIEGEDEGFVNLVTVDVAEYAKSHFEKSVKKTLTIPAWLNMAALEQNLNFSQVLQEALKEKLTSSCKVKGSCGKK